MFLLQFSLVCDQDHVSSLITTIQMVGLFVGAMAFGQLGDTIGNELTYAFSMHYATVLQYFFYLIVFTFLENIINY